MNLQSGQFQITLYSEHNRSALNPAAFRLSCSFHCIQMGNNLCNDILLRLILEFVPIKFLEVLCDLLLQLVTILIVDSLSNYHGQKFHVHLYDLRSNGITDFICDRSMLFYPILCVKFLNYILNIFVNLLFFFGCWTWSWAICRIME